MWPSEPAIRLVGKGQEELHKFTRVALAFVSVAFIAGVVLLVLVRAGTTSGSNASSASRSHLLASEIDQFAVDASAAHMNTSPSSVTWVATTRAAAISVIEGHSGAPQGVAGNSGPAANLPCYLLIVTGGTFFDPSASVPPGDQGPHGGTLFLIVYTNWTMGGGGVGDPQPPLDIATLGSPETDPLSAIAPMSYARFLAKYPAAANH